MVLLHKIETFLGARAFFGPKMARAKKLQLAKSNVYQNDVESRLMSLAFSKF